jgi:hypothetical protein
MYDALCTETSTAASLLSDLRPSPNASPEEHREFWTLVYDNLVRPSWGWNFADLWALVSWVVEHPQGGERWRTDPSVAFDEAETKRLLTELARAWLDREDAMVMGQLRDKVENILVKCGSK